MNYDIKPIADYNALTHSGLLAKELGVIVADHLNHKRIPAHPIQFDVVVGDVSFISDVVETATNTTTTVDLTYTFTTETTLDEKLVSYRDFINTHPEVYAEINIDYTDDAHKYITIVTVDGFKFSGAPTLNNLTMVTSNTVQASNGTPAAFIEHQTTLLQDFPYLSVSHIFTESVCENWRKGTVQIDVGGTLTDFPYYDSYIRPTFQVTVNSGAVEEVVKEGRKDSSGILRSLFTRLQDNFIHVRLSNNVHGTLNRDLNTNNLKPSYATNFEDVSTATISLDVIIRDINYQGGIITRVEVDGAKLDRGNGEYEYISFASESPSHI